MLTAKIDPVTYQVIRNRLIAATEEMRIALQSVSGSPTVTEASDFYTGLFLGDGTFVTMGFQVTFEAPPVSQSIRYLLSQNKVEIRDGGKFKGDIITATIAISDDAYFEGNVKMDVEDREPTVLHFEEKRSSQSEDDEVLPK